MWFGIIAVCSILTLPSFGDKCNFENSPYAVYSDPVYDTRSECMENMVWFAFHDEITMRSRLETPTSIYKIQIRCESETRKAFIGDSFNGRTGVFEAPHVGSIPTSPTNFPKVKTFG